MIKLQTTQLGHTAIKRSQGEAAFGSDLNSAQTYKNPKKQIGLEHSGFKMCSENMNYDVLDRAVIKQNNTVNNLNKKTAKNVSFSGLSVSNVKKLADTKTFKFAQNKFVHSFLKMAAGNQTVFDATFTLLITCGLRPGAIMAQSNEHNKEKNKKAASHSISSGIIGYGFARLVFSPIKKGLDKIKKLPERFLESNRQILNRKTSQYKKLINADSTLTRELKAQKINAFRKALQKKLAKTVDARKFFTYGGTKKLAASKRFQTFTMMCNYIPQVLTASARSGITIAMIPYIDKYILNKIFKSKLPVTNKEDLKNDPTYKFAYINFKNTPESKKVFQNFTGVMK